MIDTMLPGLSAMANIHPMLVHFPIAFFLGALALEGLAVFRHERFHVAATWMLFLGTLSALVTVPTGFAAMNSVAAAESVGPGHDYIHVHRNWMVAVTVLGACLSAYVFRITRRGTWVSHRWALFSGLVLLGALVILGADRGARLVFEFGVGVNSEVIREPVPAQEYRGDGH